MIKSFTTLNPLIESTDAIRKAFNQPIIDISQKLSVMYDGMALNSITNMLAQYSTMSEPFRQIATQLDGSALLNLQKTVANDSFQQQINSIQNSLASFSSTFNSIAIHDNYVDMPTRLIPDDFNYTEIDSGITHESEKNLPGSTNVKRLSIPDAITVICNLITLFFTIITFLQAQQSSIQQQENHEELVRLEQQQISLQKTENKLLQVQIDATEKNAEYLLELLNRLQEADEGSLAALFPTEAALSDTDSKSQCGHSKAEPADSLNPIKSEDTERFDAEHGNFGPH